MNMKTRDAMMAELARIDETAERVKGNGAAVDFAGAYISGFPYLFSTDFNRAFCFKHKTQAREFIRKFQLRGAAIIAR